MNIEINGLEWKIEEVSSDDRRLLVNDARCAGVTDYILKIVYIDSSLSQPYKRRVLRHELGHVYIDSYLIEKKDLYSEEELVEFLALYGVQICAHTDAYFNQISRKNSQKGGKRGDKI